MCVVAGSDISGEARDVSAGAETISGDAETLSVEGYVPLSPDGSTHRQGTYLLKHKRISRVKGSGLSRFPIRHPLKCPWYCPQMPLLVPGPGRWFGGALDDFWQRALSCKSICFSNKIGKNWGLGASAFFTPARDPHLVTFYLSLQIQAMTPP